jgi:hypothetical protein
MNIESVLDILNPRPPFWLRVWLFFFLLINRKEGRRLIEEFIDKVDSLEKTYQQVIRNNETANAINAEADRKLREAGAKEPEKSAIKNGCFL